MYLLLRYPILSYNTDIKHPQSTEQEEFCITIYGHKFIGIPISMGNRTTGLMEYHFLKNTIEITTNENICKKNENKLFYYYYIIIIITGE